MSRKTLFSLLATGAVLLSLLMAVGVQKASAQDPRGFYLAPVATDTLTVDLSLKKGRTIIVPTVVTVESTLDLKIIVNDDDGYVSVGEPGNAVTDTIYVYADIPRMVAAKVKTLKILDGSGAELNIIAEY